MTTNKLNSQISIGNNLLFSDPSVPITKIHKSIYKLFIIEKNTKKLNLVFFTLLFIISLFSLICLFLFKSTILNFLSKYEITKIPWWFISTPSLTSLISFVWIITNSIELVAWKKSYSNFSSFNESNPNFVPLIFLTSYKSILKKQATSLWFTISFIFYVGIFTLIYWWLANTKIGVLDFPKWINQSFLIPQLFIYLLVILMSFVFLLYIITIIRLKIRRLNFESCLSQQQFDYIELSKLQTQTHKICAKIFFWSILILVFFTLAIIIYFFRKTITLKPKK
ncbi:Hypothetical protein, predicted transmembrane protein [Metamycoplasma alkalescens 14918]|uniref:Transmembrane protein n=1 Tax=Metamycoplasma alkalescens 14918 TaxID=1188234 RepID=N9SQH9_9BACT|nr:Hypothetical protein, predicted transmembrane protein [Metamycoplasma alkalescens 14918]